MCTVIVNNYRLLPIGQHDETYSRTRSKSEPKKQSQILTEVESLKISTLAAGVVPSPTQNMQSLNMNPGFKKRSHMGEGPGFMKLTFLKHTHTGKK